MWGGGPLLRALLVSVTAALASGSWILLMHSGLLWAHWFGGPDNWFLMMSVVEAVYFLSGLAVLGAVLALAHRPPAVTE